MTRVAQAIADALAAAPSDRPPGLLSSIGRYRTWGGLIEYSVCLDCETTFPHLYGVPSCNGQTIGACPWCSGSPLYARARGDSLHTP